jgi:hypothetical protein
MRTDLKKSCLLGLLSLLLATRPAPAQYYSAPVPTATVTPAYQVNAPMTGAYTLPPTGAPIQAMPAGPGAAVTVEPSPASCCPLQGCDCKPPCPKCVAVPDTVKRTKVLYGSHCVDFCLPPCGCCQHGNHGSCDGCDYGLCRNVNTCTSCGHPRQKRVLSKREVTVECESMKCIVAHDEPGCCDLPAAAHSQAWAPVGSGIQPSPIPGGRPPY